MRIPSLIGAAVLALGGSGALAHHSFAVFFDPSKEVKITGKVTSFRFTNPHGTIALEVADAQGRITQWRAETNAPVVLQRRGWTRESVKAGQQITIEGWPSRDGKPYIRLRRAVDGNGRLVGTAPFEMNQQS
jgi:hypothetical protein